MHSLSTFVAGQYSKLLHNCHCVVVRIYFCARFPHSSTYITKLGEAVSKAGNKNKKARHIHHCLQACPCACGVVVGDVRSLTSGACPGCSAEFLHQTSCLQHLQIQKFAPIAFLSLLCHPSMQLDHNKAPILGCRQ